MTTLYRVCQKIQYSASFASWKTLGKDDRFKTLEEAVQFAASLKGQIRKVVVSTLAEGSSQWSHDVVALWDYSKAKKGIVRVK